jgi:hypothetical protein
MSYPIQITFTAPITQADVDAIGLAIDYTADQVNDGWADLIDANTLQVDAYDAYDVVKHLRDSGIAHKVPSPDWVLLDPMSAFD